MKKLIISIVLVIIICSLMGCNNADNKPEQPDEPSISPSSNPSLSLRLSDTAKASFEGVIFKYDGTEYNINERDSSVNAIINITDADKYIIIEGHINPKVSYYGIFDTSTKTFEKDILGTNLTYHDNDINTIVYASMGEIYNYEGQVIANCNLSDSSFISNISFINDNKQIEVTIDDPNQENPTTMTFDIQ